MQLVGQGAATTTNISASGLVRGDHQVFTAVGGVRTRKTHTVTTIATTMQPVSWYSQGCDTFESRTFILRRVVISSASYAKARTR